MTFRRVALIVEFLLFFLVLLDSHRSEAVGLMSESGMAGLGQTGGYQSKTLATSVSDRELGVKLSEDTVLHVGLGAEVGYDSNVFYAKDSARSSPLLRIVPFGQVTNIGREGAKPTGATYDLSTTLVYREYLSDNDAVKAQRAFNPSLTGMLELGSGQKFGLSINDGFVRSEDPPYGESTGNIIRSNNVVSLQGRAAPGGGRLQAVLRYTNTLDLFSNEDLKYANSMGNELLFDGSWRWLPKTSIFVQVAQGMVTYFNGNSSASVGDTPKVTSYPLRSLLGLRGLVTEKLSVNLGVGYAAGFYQGSAVKNPSGISNLAGMVEAVYRPTLLTDVLVGFRHEFRNAVIGTFYTVETPYLGFRQRLFGSRFTLTGSARLEFRKYSVYTVNTVLYDRSDRLLQVGAAMDYLVQKWFYAGVGYTVISNATGLSGAAAATPVSGFDYTKQQIFARVGVTY